MCDVPMQGREREREGRRKEGKEERRRISVSGGL